MIPYGKQHIDDNDIEAVTSALRSDWLTQGPNVPKFEAALTDYCNSSHAVAVNSATSALHIACLALGVQTGDTVWTSPNSFVASANCAIYCGADVDFVDISLTTGNICISALRDKLSFAERHGKLPKVIIPVHFAGQSCDMQKLSELVKKYNVKVIEDASHAVGAKYNDIPVGSCQYSDVCVFSFHPVKIITTLEGGMALTNNAELANKMRLLRSHGITNNLLEMTSKVHGPWYYEQHQLGFNYRMNDIEAALGLSQLNKLDRLVQQRNKLADMYNRLFGKHKQILPLNIKEYSYSSYHLYVVRIKGLEQIQHAHIINALREQGIFAHLHYIPIYKQPYFSAKYPNIEPLPNTEKYYSEAVTLPIYPEMDESHIAYIVNTLIALVDRENNIVNVQDNIE
ncbi:UDP-4-amino-4,6-dideoxy-N-acetyl-beta-L-altrosamine transaminase [Alteromonas macleodii]|uniref:UDP-4-amino-4, 6-dideoxy-N-acetyl-beta-L-altrosamine transaminase n=1 Tax=Alteromonas macleodii TaxID=28108 RepID=UPI00066BD97C|nr:UDP-4-amino-4,6-dideoxy-N-acetyl-beta-L-altrosamine transaminase [Alteromonas macleodii]CAI3941021.1 6-dideoxy-N-acetyl-beta-L-altrosamine transaminase [Alteromonas macleodii]VTP51052.1 6-dideoxy-N-acetyl-beta-L-altrosamine transaminase [Alteromonas macleodii]